MSDFFNFCLKESVYPDSLKVAKVISIFKKGEHETTTNYPPLSLLSQFNKIFEKLLYFRIYSYLVRYDLLSDCQLKHVLAKVLQKKFCKKFTIVTFCKK